MKTKRTECGSDQYEIIGFEGTWSITDGVSYGCAAILTTDSLKNLTTKMSSPIESLERYENEGGITFLDYSIVIDNVPNVEPYVLVVPNDNVLSEILGNHSIASQQQNGYKAFVFRSFFHLKLHGDDIIKHTLSKIEEMVKSAMVLNPSHPRLRAIHVSVSKNDPSITKAIGRAQMKNEDLALFDSLTSGQERTPG